jgi:hypothetical protein
VGSNPTPAAWLGQKRVVTVPVFLTLLTAGGIAIGLLRPRYAVVIGVPAVVGLYWWGVESATGALAEGSIKYSLSLAAATWLAAAIGVGMVVREVRAHRTPDRDA